MDWVSREVLGWSMEWRMDTGLCMAALEMALCSGRKPAVFNTDQGSQYTSREWTEAMERHGITISMDGKGRWADNIVMERFWRTYKYDFFHLRECRTLEEARLARENEEKRRRELERHREREASKKQRRKRKSELPLWKQRAMERAEGKSGTHADRGRN